MDTESIRQNLEKEFDNKRLSAWNRGVILYAFDILDEIDDIQTRYNVPVPQNKSELKEMLTCHSSWKEYSYGGNSLVYNYDIAERLCTKSEFKKKKEGILMPNNQETWLDVQARALSQAFDKITECICNKKEPQ